MDKRQPPKRVYRNKRSKIGAVAMSNVHPNATDVKVAPKQKGSGEDLPKVISI